MHDTAQVMAHVDSYKGKKLSTNLPVKVKFLIDNDGKESKFFSHLVSVTAPHPSLAELLLACCNGQL